MSFVIISIAVLRPARTRTQSRAFSGDWQLACGIEMMLGRRV